MSGAGAQQRRVKCADPILCYSCRNKQRLSEGSWLSRRTRKLVYRRSRAYNDCLTSCHDWRLPACFPVPSSRALCPAASIAAEGCARAPRRQARPPQSSRRKSCCRLCCSSRQRCLPLTPKALELTFRAQPVVSLVVRPKLRHRRLKSRPGASAARVCRCTTPRAAQGPVPPACTRVSTRRNPGDW